MGIRAAALVHLLPGVTQLRVHSMAGFILGLAFVESVIFVSLRKSGHGEDGYQQSSQTDEFQFASDNISSTSPLTNPCVFPDFEYISYQLSSPGPTI